MRLKTAALALAAAAAATLGVYQAVNAAPADPAYINTQPGAPEPFRAQPLAVPKIQCPGGQVEGTSTIGSDPSKVGVHRDPVQVVTRVVAAGPEYVRAAVGKHTAHAFPGGQQIRLTGSKGELIGVFNIIQHPTAGTIVANVSFCGE